MKSSHYKASHRNAYRRPAELTQQSGIERVVHLRKRQPEGVFQMRSVEVLRWKVVRWRQLQPTHYSLMALIYWTDRDTKQHKQTHKNTRPNFYLDRMGTLIIKAQRGQVHMFHNYNGNVKRSSLYQVHYNVNARRRFVTLPRAENVFKEELI